MSLLRPAPCRLPIRKAKASCRTFTTTPALPVSLQLERNHPDAVADTVPAYPYGPARWYKQSNKGLYGGQRIQFGNNVSGPFDTKTRRTFQVNVLTKRLWSHALHRFVQVRVTARTLRTIDRVGGLDEYLLGEKERRVRELGLSGWWLRWAIMQQPSVKRRFERERRELGLTGREKNESKLKGLERRVVGAALEEAYAALPEASEEEMEAAAAEQEQEQALDVAPEATAEEMEAAQEILDDAAPEAAESENIDLSVTSPADSTLPPLKFRVDRGAHVILTPHGWCRTRPGTSTHSQKWIADNKFPNYVESRMTAFTAQLNRLKRQDKTGSLRDMSLLEEKEVLKDARRRFTRELEGLAEVELQSEQLRVKEQPGGKAAAKRRRGLVKEERRVIREERQVMEMERRAEKRGASDAFSLGGGPEVKEEPLAV